MQELTLSLAFVFHAYSREAASLRSARNDPTSSSTVHRTRVRVLALSAVKYGAVSNICTAALYCVLPIQQ